MSAIKGITSKSETKVSIALIGLTNSGKTSLVKRIIQSQDFLQGSIADVSELEYHTVDNLTLTTWDLKDHIPQYRSLWKRSILGADALFFLVDSTDSSVFEKVKQLIIDIVEFNSPIKLLILASKSDLESSVSVNDLLEQLDLIGLDRHKCTCDLFKFSSLTGEGLYAIGEWLNKLLFKQKERMINYVEIKASLIINEETDQSFEALFVDNPNILLLTAFRELRRKARVFSRTMRVHGAGEEVIEIANYKVVFVKEKSYVIAFLMGYNNPIQRSIEIARNVLYNATLLNDEYLNLRKLIGDLYPLDLPR